MHPTPPIYVYQTKVVECGESFSEMMCLFECTQFILYDGFWWKTKIIQNLDGVRIGTHSIKNDDGTALLPLSRYGIAVTTCYNSCFLKYLPHPTFVSQGVPEFFL